MMLVVTASFRPGMNEGTDGVGRLELLGSFLSCLQYWRERVPGRVLIASTDATPALAIPSAVRAVVS